MVDYVKKIYLKETQFSIKFTGDVEALIEQLQRYKRPDGKFRFEIKKRKAADEYGNTHFVVVDAWSPTSQVAQTPPTQQYTPIDSSEEDPDEIPF